MSSIFNEQTIKNQIPLDNVALADEHKVVIEPDCVPPSSIFTAGSTAYSIIAKIKYYIDKAVTTIRGYLSDNNTEILNHITEKAAEINEHTDSVIAAQTETINNHADTNKEAILSAIANIGIANIDTYVELTDEEIDTIINGTSDVEESEISKETPVITDTRPRIDAYNQNLDVTVTLRRISVDGALATWEDTDGESWYTAYPYALRDNVYDAFPKSTPLGITSLPWGFISLISE